MCYPTLLSRYKWIIEQEEKMAREDWGHLKSVPQDIYGVTYQLMETAKNCLLQRGYVSSYHLAWHQIAWPSVGAHTNIMKAMLDRAINFACDEYVTDTVYGYTYRELMEAASRHDLPENLIGDILDDGDRDDHAKRVEEIKYWKTFGNYSPKREAGFEQHVLEILLDMSDERKTPAGRLLYLADKFSAILEVLACELEKASPIKNIHDRDLSPRDREAMMLCDTYPDNYCNASEMWLIVYLKHKLNEMDENGFFMAITVMATLMVRRKWYNWREQEYETAE